MNQIPRCDWVPERARWSYTARSGFLAWSRKINDQSTSSRSINTQKITWPISSNLDRISLVNNPYLIYACMVLTTFSKLSSLHKDEIPHNEVQVKVNDDWLIGLPLCLFLSHFHFRCNVRIRRSKYARSSGVYDSNNNTIIIIVMILVINRAYHPQALGGLGAGEHWA